MQFYDSTCLITGVSLADMDYTYLLLRWTGRRYQPIALGVLASETGVYHCGCETDEESRNSDMVAKYFIDAFETGRFFAKDQTRHAPSGLSCMAELIDLIEVTCSCSDIYGHHYPPSTLLDGDVIVFATIAQPVWDALTAIKNPCTDSPGEQFERIFADCPVAQGIYPEGRRRLLPEKIRQLKVVDQFLTTMKMPWAPPMEPAQRYPRGYGEHSYADMVDFLAQARHDYRDVPAILAGLDNYELNMRDTDRYVPPDHSYSGVESTYPTGPGVRVAKPA
ncbi:hypothetical protein [Nocardia sp. NPDC006630]|uniref:hypothetical protein n=1 Tax=Nocardia sp. NPDC006630 TaxID=3157181 RepID=UPI0033AD4C8C